MSGADLERHFPNLRQLGYRITSPESIDYNCIAWAAETTDHWWWPGAYWPGDPRDHSLDGFISVFRSLGYEICESREHEPGFDKVAIYVSDRGPMHMARQLPSGEWTSKCGDYEDIVHPLESLEDSIYGRAAVIMKRKRSQPQGP